jgi:GNAT superfamily N-acetyltransferase
VFPRDHDDGVDDGLWPEEVMLATGDLISIAPSTAADLERVRELYHSLSARTNHLRFFHLRQEIPERELLGVVDGLPQHLTLLASLGERLIGIGELIVDDEHAQGEVAFTVSDDHHHEGVATLLLERLALLGKRLGLRRLVATTLGENRDMQLVFGTVGLPRQSRCEDGEVDVTLDLADLTTLEQARSQRHAAALAARDAATRPQSAAGRGTGRWL